MDPEMARVSRPGYLIERGKILLGLVIYTWVGLLSYGCVMSCLITAAARRDKSQDRKIRAHPESKLDESEKQSLVVVAASQPYEKEIRTVIAACQAASSGHVRILELLIKKGI